MAAGRYKSPMVITAISENPPMSTAATIRYHLLTEHQGHGRDQDGR